MQFEGFEAGALPARRVLDAFAALATSGQWDVIEGVHRRTKSTVIVDSSLGGAVFDFSEGRLIFDDTLDGKDARAVGQAWGDILTAAKMRYTRFSASTGPSLPHS